MDNGRRIRSCVASGIFGFSFDWIAVFTDDFLDYTVVFLAAYVGVGVDC